MNNDEVLMGLLNKAEIDLTLENVRGEGALDYALNSIVLGRSRVADRGLNDHCAAQYYP